jgi:P pilus assembly chaperone PapD
MNRINKKLLAVILTVTAVALGSLFMNTQKAFAATVYPYYPNDLISESLFENSGSMSVSAIQTFLNNEHSGIKGLSFTESCSPTVPKQPYHFTYYPHCGKKESTATIIYDAGKAYGINPRAIMATMQKEESLITTPYSTSGTYQASLNCAMGYTEGYASCAQSPVQGFFSQVDNGTWQLRTDIELMSGRNWWGYIPSSYPCAGATSLYSTGVYPGRTVKFANPSGTAKTITIADAATAALYCYTPYVGPKYTTGPYQGTGYSGSFNFVQSFEQWWGSTVYGYAGEVTVTTYSDAARTQQLSLSGALPSGGKIYVTVSAINTGSKTWSNSFTNVGTDNPNDRHSTFQDGSWLSSTRPARLMQSSVAPGQTGTFEFSMTAPSTDGEYHEDFGLVADGRAWMRDSATFGFDITVSNPYNASITQLGTYRDSAYSQPVDPGEVAYTEKVYVHLKAKNIGTQTWTNASTHVGTNNPHDRTSVFQDSSWLSSTRPAQLMESSVAPGQTGTFEFSMTAPSTDGTFSESFDLLQEGVAWMPAPVFTFPIKVVAPPLNELYSNVKLYSGQNLRSKNGKYIMAMQSDGNLVVYGKGKPIWASRTSAKGVTELAMQSDGNLVIYSAGHPLWSSKTGGKGSSMLAMQNDGNLVIYHKSKPIWASK